MKKFALLMMLPLALTVSACTSDIGANDYTTAGVNTVNRAAMGTVISVRAVTVRSDNNLGALGGAAAGGVAGTLVGHNDTTRILGAIGGAAIGGLAGNAAQGQLSKQGGYEYVVRLQNGEIVTITQGNDVLLTPGEKCMVIYGKQARVVPYNGY